MESGPITDRRTALSGDGQSPGPTSGFEEALVELLGELGEDPRREGLLRTPARVRRMLDELTAGYRVDVDELINGAIFEGAYDDMVVLRDIEFFSLCEHHLLPFWGRVHVGYLPQGRVIGLSKIPRMVDLFARRLQVQERMTNEIAHLLMDRLRPLGVGCVVEAAHLCAMMRGVQKPETRMVTSAMLGRFRSDQRTRAEFLSLLRREPPV